MEDSISVNNTTSNNTSTVSPRLNTRYIANDKEQSALLRIIDSLIDAVVEQSNESDEKQKTFLSYWMSPYAMMCMITAVIMNRVVIFASTRNRRRLPYLSNLILRLFAIYLLFHGSYGIFVSFKTYSTNLIIQYLLKSNYFTFDKESFSEAKFLSLPFGKTFYQDPNTAITGPTTSILRNFHLSLCISQILDTFISVASGSKPSMETGITLFEYSLAFQETQFDIKLSIEMLLISLIALSNQVNIHLLGLFNLSNFKLITSSIIGIFTLFFYGYNLVTSNLLNLPFTIILGYFPHFCVLLIILLSESIFILSGLFKFSFNDLSMSSLLKNWNSVNISLNDDFYTALINFGEFVINISINQCYVQETSNILLPKDNYINEKIKSLKTNINPYGNKLANNPDLQLVLDTQFKKDKNGRLLLKSKKSIVLLKRLKMLNNVIFKFLKLIKLKLLNILKRTKLNRPSGDKIDNDNDNDDGDDNDNDNDYEKRTVVESSYKKYRILKNEHGNTIIYKLNDDEEEENDNEIRDKLINIDEIDIDRLSELYPQLLLNMDLMENDESGDYIQQVEEEDNDSDDEYDSDFDGTDTINDDITDNKLDNTPSLNELITLDDLQHLLIPKSQSDIIQNQIMSYHLKHLNDPSSKLTRSNFNKYYTDDHKLLDLLIEKNQLIAPTFNTSILHELQSDDLGICVICHENSRQIILWPCKCLAICEQCRISLFVREFASCVCCRRPVEGYSKVYIP